MSFARLDQTRTAEIARGLAVKRGNAVTALLTGGALVIAARTAYGPAVLAPLGFPPGFVAGVLYANAFEYVLHRFLLHWGQGFLVQRHALHHNSTGAPDEARYVNFATSRLVVVLVFLANAPTVFIVEHLLHRGFAAGMFAGFTIYYVLYEEVHWRFHLGGWLPRWMEPARRHHLLHHGDFESRYNVFLPIFDWIFERRKWKRRAADSH